MVFLFGMFGVRDVSFRDDMFDVSVEQRFHIRRRRLPGGLKHVMSGLIPDCPLCRLLNSACYHQRPSPRVVSVATLALHDAMLLPIQQSLDLINRNALHCQRRIPELVYTELGSRRSVPDYIRLGIVETVSRSSRVRLF